MQDLNDKLTVILPAAGKSTRLDLPYPKEIYQLERGKALIDFSFDLFKNVNKEEIHFVIVINEKKTDIVKYLSRYKERFYLSLIYQDPTEQEYTGAIKSAEFLFSERNLVLLPDTKVKLASNLSIFDEIQQKLTFNDFAFLYKKETDAETLKTKGALSVDFEGKVKTYEDKPLYKIDHFNGYWCGFAFKRSAFKKSIEFMEISTLKIQNRDLKIEQTPIYNSPVVHVEDFKDFGTWDSIKIKS